MLIVIKFKSGQFYKKKILFMNWYYFYGQFTKNWLNSCPLKIFLFIHFILIVFGPDFYFSYIRNPEKASFAQCWCQSWFSPLIDNQIWNKKIKLSITSTIMKKKKIFFGFKLSDSLKKMLPMEKTFLINFTYQ
jgi:hypothetical protein